MHVAPVMSKCRIFDCNRVTYSQNIIFCTLNQLCGINNPLTSGGAIEEWDVLPNLPDGLEILDNGEISGVIRQLVDSNYTITASNSGGSISTILRIISTHHLF